MINIETSRGRSIKGRMRGWKQKTMPPLQAQARKLQRHRGRISETNHKSPKLANSMTVFNVFTHNDVGTPHKVIIDSESIGRPQSRIDALGRRQESQDRPAVFRFQDGLNRRQGASAEDDEEGGRVDPQGLDDHAAPQHARKAHPEFQSPDVEHSIGRSGGHQPENRPQGQRPRRR